MYILIMKYNSMTTKGVQNVMFKSTISYHINRMKGKCPSFGCKYRLHLCLTLFMAFKNFITRYRTKHVNIDFITVR